MKKILLLVRSLGLGGAERQLVLLAKGLRCKGWNVKIVTFYNECSYSLEGCEHIVLDKKSRYDFLGFFKNLYSLLKQEKPDVVYSFMTVGNLANLVTRLACPKALSVWGVRASIMDLFAYDFFARLTSFFEKALMRFSQGVIANSTEALETVCHPNKVVVYNGIDTKTFCFNLSKRQGFREKLGLNETHKVIAIVGRFDPMKDHETFFKMAKLLYEKNKNIRFVIMGNGPKDYEAFFLKLSKKLKLNEVLQIIPAQTPPPYEAFDVVVSSSAFGEGFSNVLSEALSTGIPCVGTKVGQTPFLLGEEWCGPVKDYKALALKVLDCLELYPSVPVKSLRHRIEKDFSLETMVENTIKAFEAFKKQ
ncbi:MAG TPA: glycosyltransferase [Alphaproteobacteria bacterium]|nr:glycosyltransferase [Alphaproteobacteria bacterium]